MPQQLRFISKLILGSDQLGLSRCLGTAQFPQCGFSSNVVETLKKIGVNNLATVNVLDDQDVRQGIKDFSNWPTIPQLYINGEFIGGSDIINEMFENGELKELLEKKNLLSPTV